MDKKSALYQLHIMVIIAAGLISFLGVIVLIGWYTHTIALIQILPTFVPMQYNTAMGFMFCGLSVIFIAF